MRLLLHNRLYKLFLYIQAQLKFPFHNQAEGITLPQTSTHIPL